MDRLELLAVVFTDLVGSTALRSRIGESEAEALRREHDRVLAEAAEVHAGRVVKGLGDGIMAIFPGATEALDGAAAMQRAIRKVNRSHGDVMLSIRVGVSAGEVSAEGDDYFGRPVIEAARLCALADGDQILVGEIVGVLARGHRDELREAGERALKGIPGPVKVFELCWLEHLECPVPLPAPLAVSPPIAFAGRVEQLGKLSEVWDAASTGSRQMIFVAGEPGIGKSRLLAEFARRAHATGALVLYGRCEEALGAPYEPFIEMISALTDDELALAMVRKAASPLTGELQRIVPNLASVIPDLAAPLQGEPETERYRLFTAVAELFAQLAADTPMLCIIDDLQWATKPTIMMLRHAIESLVDAPILVAGTYRDTEIDEDHPLQEFLAACHRLTGTHRITLEGLMERDITALVINVSTGAAVGGNAVALAGQIATQTSGNAFFVGEVLRQARDAIADAGRTWTDIDLTALGIPVSVRDVVARRVFGLSADTATALKVAAVIGDEFDPFLCAHVAGQDPGALLASLDSAVRAQLLVPSNGTRYRFAHALVRATLYDALPPGRRMILHRAIGIALEEQHAPAAELARHLLSASRLGDAHKAIRYCCRAGDEAVAALAFDQAATHYRNALETVSFMPIDDMELRCDVQTALGEALHRAGDAAFRDVLLSAADLARSLHDGKRLADIASALTIGSLGTSVSGEPDEPVVEVLEEALDRLPSSETVQRARLLAALSMEYVFSADVRQSLLAREAVDVARRLGDVPTLNRVLCDTYSQLSTPDNVEERLRVWGDELIVASRGVGDVEVEARALLFRAACAVELFDIEGAERDIEASDAIGRSMHQPLFTYWPIVARTNLATIRGRLNDAERLLADQLNYVGAQPGRLESIAAAACVIRFQQGRTDELLDQVEQAVRAHPSFRTWRIVLTQMLAHCGEVQRARTMLDEWIHHDVTSIPRDSLWLMNMQLLALASADATYPSSAESLRRLLVPYEHRWATNGMWEVGPVAVALGRLETMLEHWHDAERHLRWVLAQCDGLDLRTWHAWAELYLADMLLSRGNTADRHEVMELAADANARARELGLARVIHDTSSLLLENA